MKIIRIIIIVFIVLSFIVSAGIFTFFRIFDNSHYLSQITQKASLVLGQQISIGHVGLGLSLKGITLDVWPLIFSDDASFSTQPFIKVDRVRLSLDLKTLVLQKKIHITDILFQSPKIHLIRSMEGDINIRSIFQGGQFVYRHPDPPIKTFGGKLNEGSLKEQPVISSSPFVIVQHPSSVKRPNLFEVAPFVI